MHDALEILAGKAAGNPQALMGVARAMAETRPDRAAALAHAVLEMAPPAAIATAAAALLKEMVPDWHFVIVRDQMRNHAYEAALRRAVTPESRVLDIGSGTGLLAMMAARAGAGEVITCEQNPAVAEAAGRVLKANGLDRIRLIDRHSSELDLERDLGGPIDVLVSEIVSNNMVGQGCLPVMEQAARWLKPGGRMIPEAGSVRIALAWSEAAAQRRMGLVEGFDLSAFNTLEGTAQVHKVGDPGLSIRSSTADLMRFDFRSGGPFPPGEARAELVSDGRPANGFIQWIRLEMDESITYENRPEPGAKSCWAPLFYPLPGTLDCAAGETVRVVGAHDRVSLRLWIDAAG